MTHSNSSVDRPLTKAEIKAALEWYDHHEDHVMRLMNHICIRPTGSDIIRPELWKGAHWRWLKDIEIQAAIAWNRCSDEFNQWNSLGQDEKVEWVFVKMLEQTCDIDVEIDVEVDIEVDNALGTEELKQAIAAARRKYAEILTKGKYPKKRYR